MAKNAGNDFKEIGARLRAHRVGRELSPDDLARRLGISRAALYRAEKGEIAKIEMLTAISRELDISLPTLLGAGMEYLPNAVGFFERMRQLEEDCTQIVGVFSPVSYLLTSPKYDEVLGTVLRESLPASLQGGRVDQIDRLLEILNNRKARFFAKRPLIASIISAPDLERFLIDGFSGRNDLPAETVLARRHVALAEVRRIISMLERSEIGVQLGVAREPIPSTSFQVVRRPSGSMLAISPFRLGQQPNVHVGVGLVTGAPEAVSLHEEIAQDLWETSLKGGEAAEHVRSITERFGIGSPAGR
ncbi:MAG: helix-turn-helix transcriptional regulator [Rhodobacteraceae bacterium]|nr:helix-turn-helix transcriptional regulator [Paracoccaceae bacterium]